MSLIFANIILRLHGELNPHVSMESPIWQIELLH